MKIFLTLTVAFILINLNNSTFAQDIKFKLPPKSFYRNAEITLDDGEMFECSKLKIKADSISYYKINQRLQKTIALSDVNILKVKSGDYSGTVAICGGLILGITKLIAIADNSHQNNNKWPLVVGYSIVGAGVGGIIGAFFPRYKCYYFNK